MGTDLLWKTDVYLRDSVQYQIERELDINPASVGITAADGAVTLTGFVRSFAEKIAVEQAAKRIDGITTLANQIQVLPESQRADAEIAGEAGRALRAQTYVPKNVRATVSEGFVMLEGTVNREFQREAADAAIKYLNGVKGLANRITVVKGSF